MMFIGNAQSFYGTDCPNDWDAQQSEYVMKKPICRGFRGPFINQWHVSGSSLGPERVTAAHICTNSLQMVSVTQLSFNTRIIITM